MGIHKSAVVSSKAEIGSGIEIGPYCIIGDNVTIGDNTVIGAHVVIDGNTQIGERNTISPFASIGGPPQDIGYQGEDTRVIIGNDNVIREYVTINRATTKQERKTIIGDFNYIMAYAHIAHDCVLGNRIIMSNVATLAGHITIGDHAVLGGLVAVHQFVRIGAYAFLGGKSAVVKDIPPFMLTAGPTAKLYGINRKGLSRMGFSQETIDGLKKAYRIIWRENKRQSKALEQVRKEVKPSPELELLLDFFKCSKRGILR